MKRSLVYIRSASHSGSTLLALQLARHPDVATVGELSGTAHRARPGYRCSCGEELVRCSFWREVEAAMARRGYAYSATTAETDIRVSSKPWLRRLLKPLHRGPLLEALRDAALAVAPGGRAHLQYHQALKTALVESVAECTGKPVLVDSTKSGVQLKYHLRNPHLDVKLIWLVRDGRGVALSIKRNQDRTLERGAYDWLRCNEEVRIITRRLDPARWMQVRYEAFCADPDGTLDAMWRFIGVDPQRAHGAPAPRYHVLGHSSRMHSATRIQLNEKWRTDLSPDDYKVFEAIGGRMNRDLGYA